ncbi:MAG: NlpC/P60 family protein [Candidatus Nanopelagicales bacterium]
MTRTRWRSTRVTSVLLAATVLGATVLAGAPSASADPDLTRARTAANHLRDRLDVLQARAEAAAEDYGAANDALEQVVSKLLVADQTVDDASLVEQQADGRTADAARHMYMTGGAGSLYASVLSGQTISDVLDRIASVNSIVSGDIVASDEARRTVAEATAVRSSLAALTAQKHALEVARADAAKRAELLLAQARVAYDSASALVRDLVERERAAAQAAAEAAARAAATTVDPNWTAERVPADQVRAVDRAIAEATADPATPYAVGALTDVRRWLGTPYSAGGGGKNGPSTGWCSSSAPDDGRSDDGSCRATSTVGFDCSSLMVRIFSQGGLSLPRTSRQQWKIGTHVSLKQLRPGDLLFWAYNTSNPGSIHHVALYLGHGLMAHSPHTGDHVRVAQVYLNGYIGAVRPG